MDVKGIGKMTRRGNIMEMKGKTEMHYYEETGIENRYKQCF